MNIPILSDIFNFLLSILTGIINAILSVGQFFVDAVIWIASAFAQVLAFFGQALFTVIKFLGDFLLLIVNTLIQIIGAVWALLVTGLETLVAFLIGVANAIIDVIEIVGMVIYVVIAIGAKVAGWLVYLVQFTLDTITGIQTAPVVPVEGLPRCISAPTDWDWCAVWYIGDYTLFAPGTIGEAIVPILVLMIDLLIVAYIVRQFFKAIRWFQSLQEVS